MDEKFETTETGEIVGILVKSKAGNRELFHIPAVDRKKFRHKRYAARLNPLREKP